jgi:predicted nucleotidyltransferase component of viral defense system
MNLSREKLMAEAAATGYRPEMLEKVIHLLNLLETLRTHPFIRHRCALKGGTALNLFVFELPRLSVDIDLNYIASADRAVMLAEKPILEKALADVFAREGFTVNRQPADHAGGKWRLSYRSAITSSGNLEVDLNFMLRVPLWPPSLRDSRPVGSYQARGINVLDVHELAVGKLAALMARHASRDLFDAHQLLTAIKLDPARLRLGFVLYGAMNRVDWRTVSLENLGFDRRELQDQLIPLLSEAGLASLGNDVDLAERLVSECREAMAVVLPLNAAEREFLDRLNDAGEIRPELLTNDAAVIELIARHPQLLWKAMNVREHKSRLES